MHLSTDSVSIVPSLVSFWLTKILPVFRYCQFSIIIPQTLAVWGIIGQLEKVKY